MFPDHWSFYIGEFALYSFLLLLVTGICLAFSYTDTAAGAYASVISLTSGSAFGYLIRQIHHWSAVAFVAFIIIHMARVFFTAAYRSPRQFNWLVGLALLALAILAGFTGYSLPFDALSGIGLRIANSVMMSIPFVGAWAANALNGGVFPGVQLIPHLAFIHIWIVPIVLVALITLHMVMLIVQKHTQYVRDPAHVIGRRFWPDYALRMTTMFALFVGVILICSSVIEINPLEIYGPYHDWIAPNPAVPDWYAAFLDGALRLGPVVELRIFGHPLPAIFWPGVVLPGIVMLFLAAWPWIDVKRTGDYRDHDVLVVPTEAPFRIAVGAALITAGVVLTFAASDDQQALALHVPISALVLSYRIALVAAPFVVGFLAATLMRELHARRVPPGAEQRSVVSLIRNESGGFVEEEGSST